MKPLLQCVFLLNVLLVRSHQADAQAMYHGSRDEKAIALTFDACPSSIHGGFDERIIQTLVDSGVPATFFLTGRWIIKHHDVVKKLALVPGFELGNHSYSHPHCLTMSDDSIKQELQRTENLLNSIAGISAKLFRPPYVETDQRVEYVAQKIGIITVMYNIASGDPDSTISRERLIRNVVRSARNGCIILMHVNGRGWHTSEALPEIIQALRAQGFIFSKVSELIKAENGAGKSSIDRKNPS